jgi:AcrR family transcriptional regulator
MNGHDRRSEQIRQRIRKAALELFLTYGADKVNMEEIAAKANVSKVTLYKYFHNKETLFREVTRQYAETILAETEALLNSDLDVLEKLKLVMLAQLRAPKVASSLALFKLLEEEEPVGRVLPDGRVLPGGLRQRMREIMLRFFEEGQREGLIDPHLSFEVLYAYSEVFQAGFMARMNDPQFVFSQPEALQQLIDLYYFGIFRRPG